MADFRKELIDEPLLKGRSDLTRMRNGRKQQFYESCQRSCKEAPFLEITHELPEMYAELIDGEWWWVNGCAYCDDAHPDEKGRPFSYQLCDKHNVCGRCGQHRSVFKEPVWGRSDMAFCCNACQKLEDETNKQEALRSTFEKFPKLDEDYHHWREDNIKCPYCLTEIEDDEGSHSNGETECECPNCGEDFTVSAEISIEYTTIPKRSKEDVYREAGLIDDNSETEDECQDEACEDDTTYAETVENRSESFTEHLQKRDEMSDVINQQIEDEK